jgi:hypothetical protein
MTIALAIFGVALAATSIWLTVRIVIRRERWAKWMAVAVAVLPVLYVASFGPACWAVGRGILSAEHAVIVFRPIVVATFKGPAWAAVPLRCVACMTSVGEADGLGELQYVVGYRDVLGGAKVYRVDDLVVPARGNVKE